jgi:hypothetical protein
MTDNRENGVPMGFTTSHLNISHGVRRVYGLGAIAEALSLMAFFVFVIAAAVVAHVIRHW